MNIFFREMKANRKSLIIWCVSVFLMVVMGMVKYPGIASSGANYSELMGSMPKMFLVLFGMSSLNLAEISGYFGVLYLYFLLMATIHAAMLGANIISKEERDKTAEFLLAKPVSRSSIVTFKLLAAFVNILVFNIVTLVASLLIIPSYNKGASINDTILLFMFGMFFMQLIFLFIGSGLGALVKNPKSAASAATGVLLVSYFLSVLIDLNENVINLKFFTPFKYFEAKNLLANNSLDLVFVALSGVIIVVFIWITYSFYEKRDVK